MAKETIGRYELQSEIGHGGMASVYLAYDPSFRRNVAIKLVSVSLQQQEIFRERFEREARLIARIEHPAIVPVYDFGERDGQPYLVMRYMPGGPLASKIKEGGFSLTHATQILSQIAPALDAVHAQGIIHRDLKPANILLDAFGNPAISDFGIAHFSLATNDLTGSAVIGTPAYMSPEQVQGEEDLDGRSDVYALGVILFEMLTGRGPYRAPTPISVAMKHLHEPIPSALSFRPDLPAAVDGILQKAMAKDRAERYACAADLANDLREIGERLKQEGSRPTSPAPKQSNEEQVTEIDNGEQSARLVPTAPAETPMSPPALRQTTATAARSKTSTGLRLAWGLGGLVLCLVAACSLASLLGVGSWLGIPGLASRFSQGTGPAPSLVSTSDPQEAILFSDDFSDPSSGWPILEESDGSYSYRPDGYHIAVDKADAVLWAKTSERFDNSSMYVDAKPLVENRDGYYGVLCRIQDDQNFYYFVVRNNGEYTVGKYKNGKFESLSLGWKQNDAIHTGSKTNRIQADCSSDQLRLHVNDVLVEEVTDTDFKSGFGGILSASLDPQRFEVLFNNLEVTDPDQ